MHRSSFCDLWEVLASGGLGTGLATLLRICAGWQSLPLSLSKEASPPSEILCFDQDFLVRQTVVDASEEEGAWLEASDGKRHTLHGSSSLGRTGANRIVLDSPKVSRQHALIHLQNIGEFWLIDFGSSNGTFLNKRRIHHPVRLSDGDQITVGDSVFKFR